MAGLMAVTLFAFGGVVLDLGHLYIAKTELQNASDAAALAGAKELNHKLTGVTAAVNRAIATAAQHKFDFNTPVNITIANIRLGTCPNATNVNTWGRPGTREPMCTFVAASSITSDTDAAGLTFIEVDTGNRTLGTYLMRVAGAAFETTQTSGYAVAGWFQTLVTPIGVCAVDPGKVTDVYEHSNGQKEFVELGFRRGVTYNLFALNPLTSGPSDPYLINPVDAHPSTCSPGNSSAAFTAPFICTGNSAVAPARGGFVYTNTGMTAALAASLNSRFDMYGGPSVCDRRSAPPDVNVMPYPCRESGSPGCGVPTPPATPPLQYNPIDWMDPAGGSNPQREFVDTDTVTKKPKYWSSGGLQPLAYANYGPLWSYTRPRHPDAANASRPGLPFTLAETQNSNIYDNSNRSNYFNGNYPTDLYAGTDFPTGTPTAPYNQTATAKYFDRRNDGVRDRRVLNIVLVDCTVPATGPNSCAAMKVAGIGKFFMQVPADFSGGPDRYLDAEFAGLVEDVPLSEIRLYR